MTQATANKIKKSITELIGNTPLLEVGNYNKQHGLDAEIVVKLEYFNPLSSVKDRIAHAIIEDFEQKGLINKDTTLIEMTSGNTGVALAGIAAAKGYKAKVYIQDGVSEERTKVTRAFGAEILPFSDVPEIIDAIERTGGADFVEITNAFVEAVIDKQENVLFLNQIANEANPGIHAATTGPEIWQDTDGQVDIFVATVGTGGSVSGVGKYLKSKNPAIQIVAVQPGPNSIATPENPEVPEITGVHKFTEMPETAIPQNINFDVIDEVVDVETSEAYEAARQVAKTDGVLVGTSSGAALFAATQLAKRPENKGKRIVALLGDTGLRYLSTDLFE